MPSVRPRISWLPLADLSQTPCVHPLGLLRQPSRQGDDLADHQLDDAAGVGVRRVEDRDAALGGAGQVDLVGADAEAADRDQVGGRLQHPRRDVGVGADPEQLHATCQRLDQLVLGEGAGAQLDLVAARLERLDGDRVDVLEEEDLHAVKGRSDQQVARNRRFWGGTGGGRPIRLCADGAAERRHRRRIVRWWRARRGTPPRGRRAWAGGSRPPGPPPPGGRSRRAAGRPRGSRRR